MRCGRCGEEGHTRRTCTPPKRQQAPRRCGLCREEGHTRGSCPAAADPPRALPRWPLRTLFEGPAGGLELFEMEDPPGREVVFWRFPSLHTHWWRGPAHSRIDALFQAAQACGASVEDFRPVKPGQEADDRTLWCDFCDDEPRRPGSLYCGDTCQRLAPKLAAGMAEYAALCREAEHAESTEGP